MFQYAAGRALSLEQGQPLFLDVSGFVGYGLHHGFELQSIFDCPILIASESDMRNVLGWQSSPLALRFLRRPSMRWMRREGLIVEPHLNFWAEISDAPRDSYLSGYWQSEKYFHKVAETIRSDFSFTNPLSQLNVSWANKIAACQAVSLHVRRGDYVADLKTNANHGVLLLDYYRASIDVIAARVTAPEFFIFSDDISWVKAQLKIDFPCHYIDHNQGKDSYNDMRLMSLCKHHIIANSSFSWWGAWLNRSPEKIVIAPKQWFANAQRPTDLLPQAWISL
jgi:hypothetical protein